MSKDDLIKAFQNSRSQSENLCQNLAIEDYVIQSIEDVSPPKWHLAHTSWFFETFILKKFYPKYQIYNPYFNFLFNSYYQGINLPYPRAKRGLLSRPTVSEVYAYRHHINNHITELLENTRNDENLKKLEPLIILGINHEQQHQELLLMDIKHNFSMHPDFPTYTLNENDKNLPTIPMHFLDVEGGIIKIGFEGNQFAFDNERPAHPIFLNPYRIANRLVTNSEFLSFIEDKGYLDAKWWLSDGWDLVQKQRWNAPLYWYPIDKEWYQFSLQGLHKIHLEEPVSHLSFYEADAFARWSNKRLPSEQEWEHFVNLNSLSINEKNNFMESKLFYPEGAKCASIPQQFFGELWEWTASPYTAYPGFKPLKGVLGEYNGKFMANQMVLRGGSCVTPRRHIRTTYRNFFQPEKRWQFSGLRLAENA